jgi:tetratricopeptide (TPR) repeat protein
MIAKNEERNLPRCLASVQGVVDEIILVDTGSTDKTVKVAQTYGARVFAHVWQDDFARARNASLEPATGDWILALDADEELEPDTRVRLRSVLEGTDADGLFVCQRNFLPPRALAAYGDVKYVRLFRRRPGFAYELPLHEQIVPSILRQQGRLAETDLVIWHYGYAQPVVQGQENRLQRNVRVLEQALLSDPRNVFLCASLGLVYKQAGQEALAATHLQRALEMGAENLPEQMLAEVFFTRAQLARMQGNLPLALESAGASARLGGPSGLNALNFSAQINLQIGEQEVQAAQAVAQQQPANAAESEAQLLAGQQHLRRAHQAFRQAGAAFDELRGHPLLNPAARPEVEAALERCQGIIRSMAAYGKAA